MVKIVPLKMIFKHSIYFPLAFLCVLISACSKDAGLTETQLTNELVTFELIVTAAEGGTVNTAGGSFEENSSLTITATPNEGYIFSGWTGDASGTTNPLSITMDGDKNLTAIFTLAKFNLSVNVVGQGTVSQTIRSASKTDQEYNAGSVVELRATPNSGWIKRIVCFST